MKRRTIIYTLALICLLGGFTACEDMLDVSSSAVQYEDRHELNSAGDSLYSVVGVLSKLQTIADRTVLLGELRGDLVTDNENTEKDLRELINHNVSSSNAYNDYSDYYAIINNCNYFLEKVDTNVVVSNQKVMRKEVAAVKAIRAWTYMQLALIYQSVPFITEPILSLQDAERWEKECEYKDLDAMCDYFIPELIPYVDVDLPHYGDIDGYQSKKFFLPIRLLLGDMYLWKSDYEKSFSCYAEYMYKEKLATYAHGVSPSGLSSLTNDIAGLRWSLYSSENISIIRMASSKLYGITSNLENVFSPTDINEGKRAVSPSRLWKELSEKQVFAYQQAQGGVARYFTCGDLRAIGTYRYDWSDGSFNPSVGSTTEAWYQVDVDNKYKINSKYGSLSMLTEENSISIYRVGTVYLRMAEALNRMGRPEEALSILKYGVDEVKKSVDGQFTLEPPREDAINIVGIHSRGSGNAAVNEYYGIDYSNFDFGITPDSIVNRLVYVYSNDTVKVDSIVHIKAYYGVNGMDNSLFADGHYNDMLSVADSTVYRGMGSGINKAPDTIRFVYVPTAYLVDKVELMIVDEMALETAFEGHRYYDLMRVAMRREDPDFLAKRVAHRNGELEEPNTELYVKLNDPTYSNWFIHKE